MVYRLKMVIFHGYVSHNQMVSHNREVLHRIQSASAVSTFWWNIQILHDSPVGNGRVMMLHVKSAGYLKFFRCTNYVYI